VCLAAGIIGLITVLNHFFTPEGKPGGRNAPEGKSPSVEPGPFVLVGGKGVAERKFDTLAEALQHASGGDTIEVRGNGPFDCDPVKATRALTIRAGAGFRPVLRVRGNISTDWPLALEGLELQPLGENTAPGHSGALVNHGGSSLHLANCRFREHRTNLPCVVTRTRDLFVRNCEFLCSDQSAITGLVPPGKRWVIENCVAMGVDAGILQFNHPIGPVEPDAVIRLRRNTVVEGYGLGFYLTTERQDVFRETPRITVEAADNLFDVAEVLFFVSTGKALQPKEIESLLRLKFDWREGQNLFAPGACTIRAHAPEDAAGTFLSPKILKDWKTFWRLGEVGSAEDRPKYQGGDVRTRFGAAPDKLSAEDFRLRPDSPGYRAGKDLGADIDLVGPGAAYERWKKTPDYQKWLKETGQK
jgi:hypothetical protein